MSRLATVVGALSAIVSLVDYLAAKSFLSHWLQRQISHNSAGWRISPTLNLLLVAAMVGLIWLATDSPAADPLARKRLFRLRAQLVTCGLAVWFLFGPTIGELETANAPADHTTAGGALTTTGPHQQPGSPTTAVPSLAQGHTSQFTWHRPLQPATDNGAWKPGDGLRAMARLLENASAVPVYRP